MKKFLMIALIVMSILNSGCGSKYSDETLIVEYAFWTEDKENIPDLLDAINTHDVEFLAQQVIEGKVNHADKETKIAVIGEFDNGKVVEIKFLQGRYKNKVGYTLSECVKDLKKEREKAKIEQSQKEKAEQARLEQEQANFEKAKSEGKAQLEQLIGENKELGSIKDGLQIVCTMSEGTNAYQKVIGATNLPEGMRITILLGSLRKGVVIQEDGSFSALFERSFIPVGEQNISISTLDKDSQPPNILGFDEAIIESKNESILGKEIYSGKINVK